MKLKIKNFLQQFRRGNTGQATKNASYEMSNMIISRVVSLFLTMIIARLVTPELYGLYSLTFGTIALLSIFSDLGVGAAITSFMSKNFDKDPGKNKSYFRKLLKIKLALMTLTFFVMVFSAGFIANDYYDKPIFMPLLAGAVYMFFVSLVGFFETVMKSKNDFRSSFVVTIITHSLKLVLIPLMIVVLVKSPYQGFLISALVLIGVVHSVVNLIYLRHKIKKEKIFDVPTKPLSEEENKVFKRFILIGIFGIIAGSVSGYIDTIMLGRFVDAEFIAFYSVAGSLVGSVCGVIGIGGSALFPLFSKLDRGSLNRGFKKYSKMLLGVSVVSAVAVFIFSDIIITLIYGKKYLAATPILRLLSISIITMPLSHIRVLYLTSQKNIKWMTIIGSGASLFNIVLNYVLVIYGLRYGMFLAVVGVVVATVIVRVLNLVMLDVMVRVQYFRKKSLSGNLEG